jgi:hypothetical protein
MIKGTDNNKYGSVKTLLQSQYSMQQDQYHPKDLLAAQDMLSQHQLDNWKHPTPKGKKNTNKDNNKENEEEEQKSTVPWFKSWSTKMRPSGAAKWDISGTKATCLHLHQA